MNIDAHAALLPKITETNQPFWDGCAEGELRLQTCTSCGRHRFPDAPVCPNCLSPHYSWKLVSGRGVLWSWIVMHQNYLPAFADDLPYLVAFVRLDEGPYLISTLVDPPEDLRCDQSVEVVFDRIGERALPKFRLIA
jgi:uncharacterized OB-fold protein